MKRKKKVCARNIPIKEYPLEGKCIAIKIKWLYTTNHFKRNYFNMLEIDDDVIRYLPQPLKVDIYVPDVLVERKDKKQLVKVKPSEKVKNMDDKLAKKNVRNLK